MSLNIEKGWQPKHNRRCRQGLKLKDSLKTLYFTRHHCLHPASRKVLCLLAHFSVIVTVCAVSMLSYFLPKT